jgi:orotidine-5'-phosphate decarboxylase
VTAPTDPTDPTHPPGPAGPTDPTEPGGPTYGARLARLMGERGRLCVGIDPHPGLLAAWDLPDDPGGLERFALTCAEALAGEVALLKPQSAFFERHGSAGIAVLERLLGAIHDGGALSLLDVKRGDIGSTMTAYAQAYLDPASPLAADAVTVSPYLGYGSLRPMVDLARAHGRGVFVLALTSNPEGAQVQHAVGDNGISVARAVAEGAEADNAGATPLGSVGLVVGATVGSAVADLGLDLLAVNGPVLAPGFGAQGGSAEGLRAVFGPALSRVLPSSSREILAAGPDPARLREAAKRTAESLP